MTDKESDNLQCAFLIVGGIIALTVGLDLVGRLYEFMLGELKYLACGMILLAYIFYTYLTRNAFDRSFDYYKHEIEKRISDSENIQKSLKSEYFDLKSEIKFLRSNIETQQRLCEKTIQKVDKLLEQKTPVIVAEQSSPVSENIKVATHSLIQDAADEVMGVEV